MNILMAFNDGFLLPGIVSIYSLFKHNDGILLKVMYIDLSINSKSIIKKLEKVGIGNRIEFVKIGSDFLERITIDTGRWRSETFFRYFAHELFPDLDRCVWLDSDIMVRGSIEELCNIDFEGNSFGAVADNSSNPVERLGIDDYVNAGILAMNLKKIREERSMERFWEIVDSDDYVGTLPDQDALNIAYKDDIKLVSFFYNTFVMFVCDKMDYYISNAKIVHFPSANKPWKTECSEYFVSLFDDYPSVAKFVPEYWDLMEEAVEAVQ